MTSTHGIHPQVFSHLDYSRQITKAASALAGALASSLPAAQREADIAYKVGKLRKAVASTSERPSQGFSGSGRPSAERPLQIEDKLTIAAVDATVAEVLLNASKAVGETSDRTDAQALITTVRSADAELARLQPLDTAVQGFAGKPARRFVSTDLAEAARTFKSQANTAVDKVLEESENAVSKIFSSLADKKDDILKGFSEVGKLFGTGSDVAVLLGKAWEKLMSALTTLREIVNSAPVQDALKYLTELKDTFSIRGMLERAFQADALHTKIDALQIEGSLGVDQVDACSTEVAVLQERYTKVVRNVMTVTHIAAALLPFAAAHFAGPFAALAVPGSYSLSIVAIVLLGRDYTSSGLLNPGKGIQKIVVELLPAEAAS